MYVRRTYQSVFQAAVAAVCDVVELFGIEAREAEGLAYGRPFEGVEFEEAAFGAGEPVGFECGAGEVGVAGWG